MALNTKELIATGGNGHHNFTLIVNEEETNESLNQSLLSFNFKLSPKVKTWDWSNWGSRISYKITIGTKTYTGTIPNYDGESTVTLKNDTLEIKHEDDGSKKINISFSVTDTTGKNYTPGNAESSGTMKLTNISRINGVSCSSAYIGETAIIVIDKKNEESTSTIWCNIKTLTKIPVVTKTKATSISLNTSSIEDDIYELMPNAREIDGVVVCETYNGDTKVGTEINDFKLYAKESVCKPDVDVTIVDTNETTIAVTGDSNKLVKYISKPKVTILATPKKSTIIKNYLINLNDGQTSNSQEDTFDTFNSNNITVGVTDSREYSTTKDIDISDNLINYIKLHINKIELERTEQISNEIILNADGVWFNGSFSEETINSLSVKFQYKKSSETTWSDEIEIIPTIENNTFKFVNVSLGNIFDFESEYQFKFIIKDVLMTIGNEDKDIITVPKGQEIIAIGENGVWVDGFLKIFNNHVVESGNNTNGEYIKFYDGTLICTKRCTGTVDINETWGNLYDSGEDRISLGNYPMSFINFDDLRLSINFIGGNGCWIQGILNKSKSYVGDVAFCSATSKSVDYMVDIIAIGRWKE